MGDFCYPWRVEDLLPCSHKVLSDTNKTFPFIHRKFPFAPVTIYSL